MRVAAETHQITAGRCRPAVLQPLQCLARPTIQTAGLRLQTLVLLIDITSARDAAARHRLIGKLPPAKTDGKVKWKPASFRIASASQECYDANGAPDACATEQDLLDLPALADALEPEIVGMQADVADAKRETEDECRRKACEEEEAAAGGPSVDERMPRCLFEIMDAGIAIGTLIRARIDVYTLGTAATVGLAALGSAVFWSGVALVGAIAATYLLSRCIRQGSGDEIVSDVTGGMMFGHTLTLRRVAWMA